MNDFEKSRGSWGSRAGFVIAAAGSAIGLGNIWKFPYITGQNGGVVGGELGGVEGGKVGGDIASLGIGQSRGLCTRKPNIRYPEQAKQMGVEGTVKVRILVGTDGKIAKKKDEFCKGWHQADKKTRRVRWHPRLCMTIN